jgi:catechol 2,3-dioxygenase-like lactoylglutathione lyase family enzyme
VIVPPGMTDDAVHFYELIGLRRTVKPAGAGSAVGAWLDVDDTGATQLHISERDGAIHPDQHFALVVDDLIGTIVRLREAGASWTEQDSVDGGRRGFTRDPAGNRVELSEA